MVACASMAQAAPRFVTFTPQSDAIALKEADISFSVQEDEGVKIAIRSLQTDMANVLGASPLLKEEQSGTAIVIGTLGRNPAIDRLKLKDLKGKREKFIITTTTDGTIVIAGSDRRGTIYGIYELSRQLGVSPWYWWADAPIAKQENAYIIKGTYTDGLPLSSVASSSMTRLPASPRG